MSRVDTALILRDTIQKIVDEKLRRERPGTSYATVTGFNPTLGTVSVRYDGDDIDIEIPAGSIYPSDVGQVVRIEGPAGGRVIADVKGENLTEVKVRDAQETADGKNTVHYGDEEPEGTDHKPGDIWFDSGNSNMPNTWIDGQWVSIEDQRVNAIQEAQDELRQDLDTVVENGVGTKTFYKPTQPALADSKEGDLWFDTSAGGNNELHTFVGGAWVSAADARISAIAQAQEDLAQEVSTIVDNGLGTKTHYKPTQPTAGESKEGDLWFDTSSSGGNKVYVYTGGAWVSASDARIAEVQQAQAEIEGDVSAAQQKADQAYQNAATADTKAVQAANDAAAAAGIAAGKGKVLAQSSAPGSADRNTNTLWIDTTGSANTPKRWTTGTTWVAVTDKAATDAASAAATAQTKANEAKSAADAAQSTANAAGTAADAAQAKADQAKTAADAAQSTASGAQTTATNAGQAAADAAGIAGGKADVLIQPTAPVAAMRKATTLWIDTTGGTNIPKRWTTGTTWVAVTDKTATDAASAAATAQTKADQAKTAADAAKTAADAAQSAADAAQSTATEALTSANTKNAVTRSTANPPAIYVGRVDDIWWKMSSMSSGGRVIGQYRWSGNAWIVETIDNAVIATLDAAKITTGYLAAARIKANSLNANTVLVDGSVGTTLIDGGAITTGKIAVGAITAESGIIASLDAGKITVGTLDSARIAANSITADKVLIGSDRNLIPNGDLSLGNATGWRSTLTYSTDAPDGFKGSVYASDGATRSLEEFGRFPVTPGETIVHEVWLKADKTGSRMYFEVRNQDGASLATSTNRWEPIVGTGPAASYIYPVASYEVPTIWTKLASKIIVPPGTTAIYLANTFFNHSAGTVRDAVQSISGLKLYKQVGVTLIQDGAITTGKMAVGAITAESGIIASLDAGKITVGTLDSARIAANSITADKVLLEGPLNLIPGASPGTNKGFSNFAWDSTEKALKTEGAVTTYADADLTLPPGQYIVEADIKASATSRVYIGIYGRTASYTYRYGLSNQTVTTSWASYSATLNVLEGEGGTASLRVLSNYQGTGDVTTWFRNIAVRSRVGSTLILPGSITTEKLAVGAITAESGVIGSLDASKITVGTLSGARLAADAINGKQIIGAQISTSTGFPRVQLDTAGLAVYKSSSVRSFFADAATGDLSIVGDFATATAGNERVLLSNALWNSIDAISPTGANLGKVAGSGIRVGVDENSGGDIYHYGKSYGTGNSSYVDRLIIRGPKNASRINMGSVSAPNSGATYSYGTFAISTDGAGGGSAFTLDDTYIQAAWNSVKTPQSGFSKPYARMSVGSNFDAGDIVLAATGSKPTTSGSSFSGARLELHGDGNSNSPGSAEIATYSYAGSDEIASISLYGSIDISSSYGYVNNAAETSVLATGKDIRPLIVSYNGTGASFLIPFRKGTTEWGYVGSTGAMSTDDFGIQSAAGKRLVMTTTSGPAQVVLNDNGNIYFNGSSGIQWTTVPSGSGTNVQITGSNYFVKSNSSKRFKTNIEEAPEYGGILDVNPVTFHYKSHVEAFEKPEGERTQFEADIVANGVPLNYGLIAEDLIEAGVGDYLVNYDEAGLPDSISYERIGAMMIPIARNHRDEIADLKARVTDLEAKLNTP